MSTIEIGHLSKCFKNGVTALDDISFTVDSGVFGLLGQTEQENNSHEAVGNHFQAYIGQHLRLWL